MSNAVRQLPCPDCGSPVQPDREQLCPRCGYPLMFLRQPAEDDARAIPRSPNERDDGTGVMPAPAPRADTRQFPAATAGNQGAPAGHVQCPRCGYANTAARIRCERCGNELRQARPQAVVLGPPMPQAVARRSGMGWLIALIVLAVLALLILAGTLIWTFLPP
jgi:predicted amidophosphoribosyltransferase